MPSTQNTPWESLVKWTATAFILAGLFRLVNMGIYQSGQLFESFSAPELALDVSILLAFELAFVGLLGLYPRLREKHPRLALVGVLLAVVSGVSFMIITPAEYILGGQEPPAYLIPFQIAYFLGIPLSFLVFGGLSVRARSPPLSVGVLLILGGTSWLLFLTGSQTLIDVGAYIFATIMMAIGYLLRAEQPESESAGPSSRPTAR